METDRCGSVGQSEIPLLRRGPWKFDQFNHLKFVFTSYPKKNRKVKEPEPKEKGKYKECEKTRARMKRERK